MSLSITPAAIVNVSAPKEEDPPKAVEVGSKASNIATAVLATPAAISSMQSSALFGQLYCMRSSVKNMSHDASWTLAPLAAVALPIGPPHVSMVLWNLILLASLFLLHYLLVKGITRVRGSEERTRVLLMYPHCTLTSAMLLYQGTTFAAYKSLMLGQFTYFTVTIFSVVVISGGLPWYIWFWNRKRASLVTWTPNTLPNRFAPAGLWGPDDAIAQYAFFFYEFRETQRMFKVKQVLFAHAIALTASVETHSVDACHAQTGICVALVAAMVFLYVKDRPMRWSVLNYTRVGILLAQMVQLLMASFEASAVSEETVTLLSSVLCFVDAILAWVCAARDWMLWEAFRNIAPSPEKEEGEMVALEVALLVAHHNEQMTKAVEMTLVEQTNNSSSVNTPKDVPPPPLPLPVVEDEPEEFGSPFQRKKKAMGLEALSEDEDDEPDEEEAESEEVIRKRAISTALGRKDRSSQPPGFDRSMTMVGRKVVDPSLL